MNKPHKHADLIHAWADGAEIEYLNSNDDWTCVDSPAWGDGGIYRIKPDPIRDAIRLLSQAMSMGPYGSIISERMVNEALEILKGIRS